MENLRVLLKFAQIHIFLLLHIASQEHPKLWTLQLPLWSRSDSTQWDSLCGQSPQRLLLQIVCCVFATLRHSSVPTHLQKKTQPAGGLAGLRRCLFFFLLFLEAFLTLHTKPGAHTVLWRNFLVCRVVCISSFPVAWRQMVGLAGGSQIKTIYVWLALVSTLVWDLCCLSLLFLCLVIPVCFLPICLLICDRLSAPTALWNVRHSFTWESAITMYSGQ